MLCGNSTFPMMVSFPCGHSTLCVLCIQAANKCPMASDKKCNIVHEYAYASKISTAQFDDGTNIFEFDQHSQRWKQNKKNRKRKRKQTNETQTQPLSTICQSRYEIEFLIKQFNLPINLVNM
jgi:hypothetical protein